MKKYVFYTLSSEKDVDNIRYIGVTTRSLSQRLSQHKYVAKNFEKRSTPVAKWIHSLQLEQINVIIKQIDECNELQWEDKEKQLIEQYSLKFNLLNVDKGGKGIITLEKRNKSGIIRSSEAHEIKIVQLDLEGVYVKTFDSITKATKEMNLKSKSAILNVLKGRAKTSSGYYWVYEKDYLSKNYSLMEKVDLKKLHGTPFYKYCPDTHKLIDKYDCMSDIFYEIFGNKESNSSGLKNSVKNKNTFHNYYWSNELILDFSEYFDDRFKVLEINLNNIVVNKFKTNIEAAKYLNLAESTISNYIRNKTITKNNTYLIRNKKIKI